MGIAVCVCSPPHIKQEEPVGICVCVCVYLEITCEDAALTVLAALLARYLWFGDGSFHALYDWCLGSARWDMRFAVWDYSLGY